MAFSHGGRGYRALHVVPFIRTLSHLWGLHPYDPIISQKALPPDIITLRIQFSVSIYEFEEHEETQTFNLQYQPHERTENWLRIWVQLQIKAWHEPRKTVVQLICGCGEIKNVHISSNRYWVMSSKINFRYQWPVGQGMLKNNLYTRYGYSWSWRLKVLSFCKIVELSRTGQTNKVTQINLWS